MAEVDSARLIEEIADTLAQEIRSGALAPGSKLKQELLAERFAVSRTPIREALLKLKVEGLITQDGQRSATVCAPSSRELAEMFQIRSELEALAAQLAARWISDEQLLSLRASHDRFVRAVTDLTAPIGPDASAEVRRKYIAKKAEASKRWVATNAEFHETISAASRNRKLSLMLTQMRAEFTRQTMLDTANAVDLHRMRANIDHHEKILSALEGRDPAQARAAMIQHINESADTVIDSVFHRS